MKLSESWLVNFDGSYKNGEVSFPTSNVADPGRLAAHDPPYFTQFLRPRRTLKDTAQRLGGGDLQP
ncbi:hypothetical protein K227x_15870 [Rubripirellula lacrimiformis]|uniref:Uncharacterized protein n=1 Tax=Rubripirellula lacrimiformis TaxID=1930273 RepID=A0A517N7T6_9BACT|nr:hypothetical protein K227x_15870 [Rubripirellula lacrimiformis]